MARRTTSHIAMFVFAATLFSSCHVNYSFEQEEVELDTLGEEIFKIWRKDAARAADNADAKVEMLDAEHNDFVDAVDAIAPEEELDAVDTFLQNLLALVDDGIVPALTRKITTVLREAAKDAALLDALVAPTGPDVDSFVTPEVPSNLMGHITGYDDLVPLLRLQTRIMLQNDGFTEDGSRTFDEPAATSDLVRVLAQSLREAEDEDGDPLAVTIRDLALVEDPAYDPPENPKPLYAALYDDRGYPLAAMDGDQLSFPLTDGDGDGLADVDADGKFILQNGDHIELAPFAFEGSVEEPVTRDQFGRAIAPNGPVFQYVDLNRTGLSFLLRQQYQLSQKSALYDMLGAFKKIMGPKQAYTDDIGGYKGYPQEQPLMDMSHAAVHMVDSPGLPDFLDGLSAMAREHPEDLAYLFWAFDNMIDILDEFPDAEMTDDQTVVFDLLPILQELAADPELWADVMTALRDPIMRRSGEAYATMLRYKDSDSRPEKDGPYDVCFHGCQQAYEIGTNERFDCIRACPMDEVFDEPMDFDAAEVPENISAFQKFQHLLRDTAGREYTMSIEEASFDGDPLPELPPLLVLPAAAEAMIAAIAGNLDLADYVPEDLWDSSLGELLDFLGVDEGNVASLVATLSDLFGAHLDRRPRPDQITRLFNQDDIKFETDRVVLDPADPTCHDGYRMSQHLAYGLFQAEASGVIDTIYPLAKAFSDHGREDLLAHLMVVLHNHYAGDPSQYRTAAGGPSEMKAANMRSYEPAMLKIFEEGELFQALNDFAVAQYEVEQSTGIPVTEGLRQVLNKGLQPGFTNYRGETFVVINDERTISDATALHNLLDALDEASARLEDHPEAKERLDDAVGNMAQIMLATRREGTAPPVFDDPGSIALTAHLTGYLADRAREKQDAGELSPWLTDDVLRSVEDFWKSRTLSALIDLADETLSNEDDVATLDAFMGHLLGDVTGREQVLIAVHHLLIRSIARESWLPVARFLADVIDPDRAWETEPYKNVPMVTLAMQMLNKTLDADPENTGIFLIHRGMETPQYGESPFSIVVDVIARYLSPDPTAETFQNPGDYEHFLNEMADYMADDVHGMERLYELVDRRIRPPEAASGDENSDEAETP